MQNFNKNIIDFLLKNKIITENGAKELEEESKDHKIGELLIKKGYFPEQNIKLLVNELYKRNLITLEEIRDHFSINIEEFLKNLAKELKIPYMDFDTTDINYSIASKAPLEYLKKYFALPFKEDEINVYVALKDPLNITIQEVMQRIFPRKLVKVVLADPDQIEKHLNKLETNAKIKDIIEEIKKETTKNQAENTKDSSAILKLIEIILKNSILARGSDIHIEPTKTNCIVRTRIDGALNEMFIFDKDIYPPLSSRIKLLANLDIAEKRKPQDGRFSATILNKEFDFRVSTLPIVTGESIVMRILDKSKVMIKLEDLGMQKKTYETFYKAMHAPYGIIFVTGPTGSGKSTTLYAALNAIKSVETKIITVEDPVEYQVNMIQQTQVNEKAGLTFAEALRSILRQDPDVIMIGEVRDQETLRIAIQAALTGHLVFSTLHTNDAISAVTRVVDMGIEPYLVSGALAAIEAQRLVRKLCPYCKTPTILPDNVLKEIEKDLPKNYQFYKAKGCEKCSQTGYIGREMISEVLGIDTTLSSMIARNSSKEEMLNYAISKGFKTMFQDGILRAAKGITTIEEIFRVAKS